MVLGTKIEGMIKKPLDFYSSVHPETHDFDQPRRPLAG